MIMSSWTVVEYVYCVYDVGVGRRQTWSSEADEVRSEEQSRDRESVCLSIEVHPLGRDWCGRHSTDA